MRFLFVDRILELEKGRRATGIKNVSFSDEYLINLVPNFPVLPRSLTVEAIAQLISWLVILSKDFEVKPIAVITESARFMGNVIPGDQMVIKVEIESMHEEDALCRGNIEVDGKIVAELNHGVCAFVPMDELEEISDVKDISLSLFGNRCLETFLANSRGNKMRDRIGYGGRVNNLHLVDKVLEMETGKWICGVKNLAMSEDFIADHFPKRHVMPGTMIVESIVQLSERLITETVKTKTGSLITIIPRNGHKIKFRQYVKPGDQMILEVNLINLLSDTAVVKAKVTVDGELAASMQIEFEIIDIKGA